jgi:glycosyltransferase involved in cell wall biosynthesis
MSLAPRISVLLPVRNGLPWLTSCLDSLFAQSLTDFELIVLEDGSTDDTPAVLATISDPRLRVIATGGVGVARALNIGLEVARGEYVARQDADDESMPARLERQVALLDRHPDVDVVSTTAEYIDECGNVVSHAWVDVVRAQQDPAVTPDAIRDLMPLTCCITHGSVMARRSVLLAAGGYQADMVPAEDYDLWLRLLPHHCFAKLPDRLYRYRLHSAQSGSQRREAQTRLAILAKLRYLRRLHADLPEPATISVVGSDRGNAYYRDVAQSAGFRIVDSPDWDVLAVTDFSAIEIHSGSLMRDPTIERIGNCFVKKRQLTRRIA